MGVLDRIFGNDEDDLEATLSGMGFDRPLRTIGAKMHPYMRDELGNPIPVDAFGEPIFLEANPDYDPDNKPDIKHLQGNLSKIGQGISDFIYREPKPLHEEVADVAKVVGSALYQGGKEFTERVSTGNATLGDAFGAASMMYSGAQFGAAPEGSLSLFVPARTMKSAHADLKRAQEMKDSGSHTREEIWAETGLFQFKGNKEWLTEIDDSKSEIALTQPFRPSETQEVTTTQRRRVGGGQSPDEVKSLTIEARIKVRQIRDELDNNLISQQEAESRVAQIQAELNSKIGTTTPTFENVEVTRTVPVPKKPLEKGKRAAKGHSTLDNVINHDPLFDFLEENQIRKDVTAEAGRRKAKNFAGVHYPSKWPDERLLNEDKSRVSSFSNAADYLNHPENFEDERILARYKAGEISLKQAQAEHIWSTMLHEVQHFLDDSTRSRSGSGFNPKSSSGIKTAAQNEFKEQVDSDPVMIEFWYSIAAKNITVSQEQRVKTLEASKARKLAIEDYNEKEEAWALGQTNEPRPIDPIDEIEAIYEKELGKIFDSMSDAMTIAWALERDTLGKAATARFDEIYDNSREVRLRSLSDKEVYKRDMGETKSRLTQARRSMSAEERRATPPWAMLDVDEEDLFPGYINTPNKFTPPSASEPPRTPKDFSYREDNPATRGYEGGEDWLLSKQRIAEERAGNASAGNATSNLLSGPITAVMGQNFKKSLFLDTNMLLELRGANSENRRVGEGRYDFLREKIEKEGFDPEQDGNAIVVAVNHKGEAYIMEGNTRVAIARDMNVPSVRVEIKYFNGGELIDGQYSPNKIAQYAINSPLTPTN